MAKLTDSRKERIEKLLKKHNVEPDTIDIYAYWDSSLSTGENLTAFKEHLIENGLWKVENEIKEQPKAQVIEKFEREELEGVRREENFCETMHIEAISKIKNSSPEFEKYYAIPRSLIKALLESKEINGLILVGEAGTGKSYNSIVALNDKGYKIGQDYDILNGYATPLSLYEFLYANKDRKVVILDDLTLKDEVSEGLLLGALWNAGESRIINYRSTSNKLNVPKSFEFKAKIIWCVNKAPEPIETLKSRCFYYEIKFSHKQKIELMYELAKVKNIPFEVIDFIKENTNEAYYNIDLRLPIKLYWIREAHKDNWQEIAKRLFEENRDKLLIKELLEKYGGSIKEAIEEFKIKSGRSRATFFRYKAELVSKSQEYHYENTN